MSYAEWFARRVAFPAYECLRGRPTLRETRDLAQVVRLPPAQLQRLCADRLRALLEFATRQLPFYRERFGRHGVDPTAPDIDAELAKLPVLQKSEVRARAADMTYSRVPGGLQPCVSGGTTGDTLHFYVDRMRQAQSMGARLFMQSVFGVRPGDRRVWLWGSPVEAGRTWTRRLRDCLIQEILLDAFDMSPRHMEEYLRFIAAYRPRLIIGYTSAVVLLARYAAGRWDPARFRDLRAVVVTGDEVHAEDRAAIQRAFNCPVASEYGSREVGLIAHECPQGRMHVIAPHLYLEVTQDNARVPVGECGRITCTNLNSRAQPLVRYDLGDVGSLARDACPCGLPLPVLDLTGARITGFVALPDGRLCHGHLVAYLVREDPSVVEFRVHQRTLDHCDIWLVVNEQFTPVAIAGVQARFHRCFGPRVSVDCRVVECIPPDPSGKRRHLVSDVAPQYARFDVVPTPS